MKPAQKHAGIVQFPDWKQALATANLAPGKRQGYRRAILTFLKHCKERHVPASVEVIREYLRGNLAHRTALRWFYQAGSRSGGEQAGAQISRATEARGGVGSAGRTPPPAAADLGGADWERDLIKAVRSAGLLWRTEETYRGWAARFARFLAPRSPYAASKNDVADFLTALAVEQRAAPSTQKQALNALVFLLQEALHRELGDFDFRRATPRKRVPTVLTRGECAVLFAQLEGTIRLMAELMYGSGLRLMELLRLRVQDLDLERQRLQVRGGKGDRVKLRHAVLVAV